MIYASLNPMLGSWQSRSIEHGGHPFVFDYVIVLEDEGPEALTFLGFGVLVIAIGIRVDLAMGGEPTLLRSSTPARCSSSPSSSPILIWFIDNRKILKLLIFTWCMQMNPLIFSTHHHQILQRRLPENMRTQSNKNLNKLMIKKELIKRARRPEDTLPYVILSFVSM
jgi:hypothetical protein